MRLSTRLKSAVWCILVLTTLMETLISAYWNWVVIG